MKEKENKVVDALSQKFHVAVMSVWNSNLRARVLDALPESEHYLQVKQGL